MFLGCQVGADAHVEHHDFPLGIAIKSGRPDIMAVAAILRPQLRASPFNHASSLSVVLLLLIPKVRAGPKTGFYNLVVEPGLQLIASPLDNGQSNTVQTVLPNVPDLTALYKFTDGDYSTNTYLGGLWDYPAQTLAPGEGGFIFNTSKSSMVVTFAGDFLQGQLTNGIPAGLALKGSMAFKAGRVNTDLGLNLAPFDNLYQWQTNHFVVYTVLPGGGWHPSEPKVAISESFFVNSARGTNWVQSYQP